MFDLENCLVHRFYGHLGFKNSMNHRYDHQHNFKTCFQKFVGWKSSPNPENGLRVTLGFADQKRNCYWISLEYTQLCPKGFCRGSNQSQRPFSILQNPHLMDPSIFFFDRNMTCHFGRGLQKIKCACLLVGAWNDVRVRFADLALNLLLRIEAAVVANFKQAICCLFWNCDRDSIDWNVVRNLKELNDVNLMQNWKDHSCSK